MHFQLAILTLSLFSITLVFARSYNVTIDDQMGDPTTGRSISYSPADVWNDGQTCERCTARPSPASNAYMGTWKDATFLPPDDPGETAEIVQASVPFIGTAVYVNCILTRSSSGPNGNTDLTFKIDNVTVGTFEQVPDGDTTYHFGVTVFSMSGLGNTVHTLSIESGHAGSRALVLLDSIIYTKEVEDPTSAQSGLPSLVYTYPGSQAETSEANSTSTASSSSTNTAAIVGSVIGGLVAMTTILAFAFVCYRRQRRPTGGVRVVLDTSDVGSPLSPYGLYSSNPNSPNRLRQEERGVPFVICSPSVPTLAPGDSISQANVSDNTSDWTSTAGHGNPRRTFRERARAFALSRGRPTVPPMKVQNATEADMQESDTCDDLKPPEYISSRLGGYGYSEKGKS
ncbi:hypothetical protein ACEPAI_2625 [Sanghuangporus weigelae]